MTFRKRGVWLLPLVLAFGCLEDPDNDVEIEVEETKISGGIPTTGHPYVGMIIEPQAGNQAQRCTGWVVGRRHAVTAAHCVSNRVGAIRFVEDDGTTHFSDRVDVHPDYVDNTIEHDIAVVRFRTDLPGARMRMVDAPPTVGTRVRLVGYGESDEGNNDDTKRIGYVRVDGLFTDALTVFGRTNACGGDSGGPLFTENPAGPAVVGIVSAAIGGDCGDHDANTAIVRIDTHRAWVAGLVADATTCNVQCGGRVCGAGGCGWDCGTCATGLTCTNAGQCACPDASQRWSWSYCSASCPCAAGNGDCDRDADCRPGLSCVQNVGANYGQTASLDICEASTSCPPASDNFGWSFCSGNCPCSHGQGDCDSDADCAPGTVCMHNVGARYGQSSSLDICERPALRTWDLAEDFRTFPNQRNPSAAWSYRRAALHDHGVLARHELLPAFTRITTSNQRWMSPGELFHAPYVRGPSSASATRLELAAGQRTQDHQLSIVRWTSPIDGRVTIRHELRVTNGATCAGCDGMRYFIYENGRQAVSRVLTHSSTHRGADRTINVRVGDTISFVLSPRARTDGDRAEVRFRIEQQ